MGKSSADIIGTPDVIKRRLNKLRGGWAWVSCSYFIDIATDSRSNSRQRYGSFNCWPRIKRSWTDG
jgi:hypothetical protein